MATNATGGRVRSRIGVWLGGTAPAWQDITSLPLRVSAMLFNVGCPMEHQPRQMSAAAAW